jgi:uncharacterized protein
MPTSATIDARPAPAAPAPQTVVLTVATLALAAVMVLALQAGGARLAGAVLIGGFAGVSLYHAAFGFTSGWRRFIAERRGCAMRAQLLAIGLTAIVSFPLIAWGAGIGLPTGGFVAPLGVAAMIGAFLFGLGMQLGGGCGSGTLFTVGGGSTRMLITLAFFIAGGIVATAHWEFWMALPRLPATSLIATPLGVWGALVVTIGALAGLGYIIYQLEIDRHGAVEPPRRTASLLYGPWSPLLGALALAIVGIGTLFVLGRPWGITSGFTLWGAKIAYAAGVPIETWSYWQGRTGLLERTVFADATSVMNFGVIIGALAAAALAGRFAPTRHVGARDVATAVIGGLLMGYGARLAFGCNIGGLIGGIISGSAHGWSWLLFGFLGSILGVKVRRWIGGDGPLGRRAGGGSASPPAG